MLKKMIFAGLAYFLIFSVGVTCDNVSTNPTEVSSTQGYVVIGECFQSPTGDLIKCGLFPGPQKFPMYIPPAEPQAPLTEVEAAESLPEGPAEVVASDESVGTEEELSEGSVAVVASDESVGTEVEELSEGSAAVVASDEPVRTEERELPKESMELGAYSRDCLVWIKSNPRNATVTIDECRFVGFTPKRIAVSPGRHIVRIECEGYEPWVEYVTFMADMDIYASLTPLIPVSGPVGQPSHSISSGVIAGNTSGNVTESDFIKENYDKIGILLAFLTFVTGSVLGSGKSWIWISSYFFPKVAITLPQHNSDDWDGLVCGNYNQACRKKNIYILTKSCGGEFRVNKVELNGDRSWSVRCRFDEGMKYDICAIVIDISLADGSKLESLPGNCSNVVSVRGGMTNLSDKSDH